MSIRRLQRADLQALVHLRKRCFAHSAHPDDAALEEHMARLFFANPWMERDLPSLVYETAGEIVGFQGVVPRPMRFRRRRVWAAIPTQLMVDPAHRGSVSIALLKAFLSGDQDLSVADQATALVQRLWTRLGGETCISLSLYWSAPVDPVRASLAGLAHAGVGRTALRLSRLVFALCRSRDVTSAPAPGPDTGTVPLDQESWAGALASLPRGIRLRPDVDASAISWQLQTMRAGTSADDVLQARLVRHCSGAIMGWYAFTLGRSDIAQCIQLGANNGDERVVLRHLLADVRAHGGASIRGRLQPELMGALASPPACLDSGGPVTLVHSRDPDLLACVQAGAAWFTRLDGEWWMNF